MQAYIERQVSFAKLPRLPLDLIYEQLEDFGLNAGKDFRRVYRWYQIWKNYHILPFPGGYADQPHDVLEDFDTFALIEAELEYPFSPAQGIETSALNRQAANGEISADGGHD